MAPPHARSFRFACLLVLGLAACDADSVAPDDDGLSTLDGGQRDARTASEERRSDPARDAGSLADLDAALPDSALSPTAPPAPATTGKLLEEPARDAGSAVDPGVIAAGVRWIGRVDLTQAAAPRFAWPGTGFVARFHGTGLRVQLDDSAAIRFKVSIDGAPQATFLAGTGALVLASGLALGAHTVALYRQNEGFLGESRLASLRVDDGVLLPPPPPPARLIELIGDSISTGGGALGKPGDPDCVPTQSHWDSYGAVAARALDAELSTVAASGHGVYRDYSGSTTGLLLPRLYEHALTYAETPWSFAPQPQAVVINLGTNDVGVGTDPGEPFRDAYRRLVRTVRAKYPRARIVGIIGPMLRGALLSAMRGHIAAVMDGLRAEGDDRVSAFLGIEPQTDDKLGCGDHPNAAEHALMGAQLAAELRRLLGW